MCTYAVFSFNCVFSPAFFFMLSLLVPSFTIRIISRMPESNQVVLCHVFHILHCIASNSDVNEMTAANIAICMAPTLLWPDTGIEVIRNEVPPMIIFMIDHTTEIFSNHFPAAFKEFEPFNSWEPKSQSTSLGIWGEDHHPSAGGFSGCDELEVDSEEGAASDSQAYSEMKLSPRKPNSSRRYIRKWPRNGTIDSESPDISDEDSEDKQIVIPQWQPAKPRLRSRNSEGGRDRKERRRTIGGIIDGELLGPILDDIGNDESLDQLQEQILSLPTPVAVEYSASPNCNSELISGDSEVMENLVQLPQGLKAPRKRHGRRRTEGPTSLGGLVGRSLVTYEGMPYYGDSQSGFVQFHQSSMSDSMGSSSSLDQAGARESAGIPKFHPPVRHSSMKSSYRPRRKHRRVARSSSLREAGGYQHVKYTQTASGGNAMKAVEKRSCSNPNITSKGSDVSVANTHRPHHGKVRPPNSSGDRHDPKASGGVQRAPSLYSQDEGIGSSVSATPASTLTRPSQERHLLTFEDSSAPGSLSGSRTASQYGGSSQSGSVADSQEDWQSASGINQRHLFWINLKAVSSQHSRTADKVVSDAQNVSGHPAVVRFKSFRAPGSIEHPQVLAGVVRTPSLNMHEHGSVQVTVAKYKEFPAFQQPQKIYYRYNPEYYTDL